MNIWEIHPAFVHFPLALLLSSTVLESVALLRKHEGIARCAVGMLAAGLAFIPIVATAGLLAYFTVPAHSDAADFRIVIHAGLAVTASALYGIVLLLRWRRRMEVARSGAYAVSVLAALLLGATGALGGYLVYRDGIGVVRATHAMEEVGDDLRVP